MNIPSDLKYTPNDEWIRVEGSVGTVGITDFAQNQLSDIVFVEIVVAVGDEVKKGRCLRHAGIGESGSRCLPARSAAKSSRSTKPCPTHRKQSTATPMAKPGWSRSS